MKQTLVFKTWIVRQHNLIWVCKLTDIVTSLFLCICSWTKSQWNVIHVWNQYIISSWNKWNCMCANTCWNQCIWTWRLLRQQNKANSTIHKAIVHCSASGWNDPQRPFPIDSFMAFWGIVPGKARNGSARGFVNSAVSIISISNISIEIKQSVECQLSVSFEYSLVAFDLCVNRPFWLIADARYITNFISWPTVGRHWTFNRRIPRAG